MGRGLGLQDRKGPGPLLATSPHLPRSPAAHPLTTPPFPSAPLRPRPPRHQTPTSAVPAQRAAQTRTPGPRVSAKGPSARDARPPHCARLRPRPRLRLGGVPRRAPGAAPPRPLPALDPPRCATSPARLSSGQPLPGSATPRGPRRSLRGHAPARARTRAVQPRPFHPFPATTQLARSLCPTPLPAPPRPAHLQARPRPSCRPRARAPTQPRPPPPRWSRGPAAPGRPQPLPLATLCVCPTLTGFVA